MSPSQAVPAHPGVRSHAFVWAICAALAYLLLNAPVVWHQILLFGPLGMRPRSIALFFVLYSLSGLSLCLLLTALPRYLAFAGGALILLVVWTNYGVQHTLGGHGIDFTTGEWLLAELGQGGNAFREFAAPIFTGLLLALLALTPLVAVVVVCRRSWRGTVPRLRLASIALASAGMYLLCGLVLDRKFEPAPVDNNMLIYAVKAYRERAPKPGSVDLTPRQQAQLRKVVLLVDESLVYSSFKEVLLPLWSPYITADFGEAASIGNCSASSNAMLRWGFRPASMLRAEDPRSAPTVWGYARAAGYRTILIDGQRQGAFQNYMRADEAALIDRVYGPARGFDTDQEIARLLHDLLQSPEPMFIYVNKRGTHFPYSASYPPGTVAADATREQKYRAAIRYASSRFISTALDGLPLTDSLLVYTSDHGQYFGEELLHCNAQPHWQEVSVPLLVFTHDASVAGPMQAAALRNFDRLSHANIFSTLLTAMGYDGDAARRIYGPGMTTTSPPERYFFTALNPIPSTPARPIAYSFDDFPFRKNSARQGPDSVESMGRRPEDSVAARP